MFNQSVRFSSLLIGLFLVLSACSGSDDSNVSSTVDPKKQEIRIRINDDPDFLDPHYATASISFQMILNIFESLFIPQTDGTLTEGLAESYEVSDDGLTYTFNIREGVKFHNGEKLTVDDVMYTYEQLMGLDDGEKLSNSFDNVESIETPDETTFVMTLKQPDSNFLYALTALESAIVPRAAPIFSVPMSSAAIFSAE